MNGFALVSLCFVAAVSAQTEQFGWVSGFCTYGAPYDQFGYPEFCNHAQGDFCPPGSECKTIWGSDGICCNSPPVAPLRCPDGRDPHPTASCGGIVGASCPDRRRYECVTSSNPLIADSQGICCLRSGSGQRY